MPVAATPVLTPYLVTAAIGWAFYRRIRGNFGRQPWRPRRAVARIVVLAVAMLMLTLAAVFVPHAAWAVAAGVVLGIGLGAVALSLMRVECDAGGPCYVPNPWIGAGLSALLVGRLAWRFSQGSDALQAHGTSPLTLAFAATLVAFYLTQGIGLVRRMRRLTAPGAVVVADA